MLSDAIEAALAQCVVEYSGVCIAEIRSPGVTKHPSSLGSSLVGSDGLTEPEEENAQLVDDDSDMLEMSRESSREDLISEAFDSLADDDLDYTLDDAEAGAEHLLNQHEEEDDGGPRSESDVVGLGTKKDGAASTEGVDASSSTWAEELAESLRDSDGRESDMAMLMLSVSSLRGGGRRMSNVPVEGDQRSSIERLGRHLADLLRLCFKDEIVLGDLREAIQNPLPLLQLAWLDAIGWVSSNLGHESELISAVEDMLGPLSTTVLGWLDSWAQVFLVSIISSKLSAVLPLDPQPQNHDDMDAIVTWEQDCWLAWAWSARGVHCAAMVGDGYMDGKEALVQRLCVVASTSWERWQLSLDEPPLVRRTRNGEEVRLRSEDQPREPLKSSLKRATSLAGGAEPGQEVSSVKFKAGHPGPEEEVRDKDGKVVRLVLDSEQFHHEMEDDDEENEENNWDKAQNSYGSALSRCKAALSCLRALTESSSSVAASLTTRDVDLLLRMLPPPDAQTTVAGVGLDAHVLANVMWVMQNAATHSRFVAAALASIDRIPTLINLVLQHGVDARGDEAALARGEEGSDSEGGRLRAAKECRCHAAARAAAGVVRCLVERCGVLVDVHWQGIM
eukprot:3323318-Rhodomonas_salina.1